MHTLDYLLFDQTEGADGVCSWDAMASVQADHLPALRAEVEALLNWAHQHAGPCAPVDEGGDWDLDLQAGDDDGQPLPAAWDGSHLQLSAAPAGRTTLSLTLSGSDAFAQLLTAHWQW